MTSQHYDNPPPDQGVIQLPTTTSIDWSVRAMYRELLSKPVPVRLSRLLNEHESRLNHGAPNGRSDEPDPLSRRPQR